MRERGGAVLTRARDGQGLLTCLACVLLAGLAFLSFVNPAISRCVFERLQASAVPQLELGVLPESFPLEGVASTIQVSITNRGAEDVINARVKISPSAEIRLAGVAEKPVGNIRAGGSVTVPFEVEPRSCRLSVSSLSIESQNFPSTLLPLVVPVLKQIGPEALAAADQGFERVVDLRSDTGVYEAYRIGSIVVPLGRTVRDHTLTMVQELLEAFFVRDFIFTTPGFVDAFVQLVDQEQDICELAQATYNIGRSAMPVALAGAETVAEFLLWRFGPWGTAEAVAAVASVVLKGRISPEFVRGIAELTLVLVDQFDELARLMTDLPDVKNFLGALTQDRSPETKRLIGFLNITAKFIVDALKQIIDFVNWFFERFILPIEPHIRSFKDRLLDIFRNVVSDVRNNLALRILGKADDIAKGLEWLKIQLADLLGKLISLIDEIGPFLRQAQTVLNNFVRMASEVPRQTQIKAAETQSFLLQLAELFIGQADSQLGDMMSVESWMMQLAYELPEEVGLALHAASYLMDYARANTYATDRIEAVRASKAADELSVSTIEYAEQQTKAMSSSLASLRGEVAESSSVHSVLVSVGHGSDAISETISQYERMVNEASAKYAAQDYWRAVERIQSLEPEAHSLHNALMAVSPYAEVLSTLLIYKSEGLEAREIEASLNTIIEQASDLIASKDYRGAETYLGSQETANSFRSSLEQVCKASGRGADQPAVIMEGHQLIAVFVVGIVVVATAAIFVWRRERRAPPTKPSRVIRPPEKRPDESKLVTAPEVKAKEAIAQPKLLLEKQMTLEVPGKGVNVSWVGLKAGEICTAKTQVLSGKTPNIYLLDEATYRRIVVEGGRITVGVLEKVSKSTGRRGQLIYQPLEDGRFAIVLLNLHSSKSEVSLEYETGSSKATDQQNDRS